MRQEKKQVFGSKHSPLSNEVDKFLTELANWKHGRILKINKYTHIVKIIIYKNIHKI